MKNIVIISLTLFVMACSRQPSRLEEALTLAGENRAELEKVLDHYKNDPADSLKYEAAVFLIENMPGKYSEDNRRPEEYSPLFKRWNELLHQGVYNKQGVFDSLVNSFNLKSSMLRYEDVKHIKGDYLINNIDRSFEVGNYPWNKNMSFERFCEEILPYRLDAEPLEYWRDKILEEFHEVIDSIIEIENIDAVQACAIINSMLIKEWEGSFTITSIPPMSYTMLKEAWTGTCRERSALGVFTMRALGIPVTRDFTPQWPHRRMGHNWNTVSDLDGNHIVFMATESNPGEPHEAGQKMAKVYRRMFQLQPGLTKIAKSKEFVPFLFRNQTLKDVSGDYFEAVDVWLKLKQGMKNKYAYLTVFDNQKWVPINYADVKNGSAVFNSTGKDIVYLPVCYNKKEKQLPVEYAFRLMPDGSLHFFIPDTTTRQTIRLLRKYPLLMNAAYTKRMKGGRFEGSNSADFKNPELLHLITDHPDLYFQEVQVSSPKPFRYVRYMSPDSSYCNIAELEFYGNTDNSLLKGEIIGTPGSYLNDPSHTIDKAFDGNPLTFVDAASMDGNWVGLELESPAVIKKIRYLPRNDDNNIAVGQMYELFYWDFGGWVSLGRQIAEEQKLIYENVPANALLLLRNLSKGTEERIFTYENGKQVWW